MLVPIADNVNVNVNVNDNDNDNVNEIITEINNCVMYRMSLQRYFNNLIYAKQIQRILQNKGFDVSLIKNDNINTKILLIIKWDSTSKIRNISNLTKTNDELADFHKIKAKSILHVKSCAEHMREVCTTNKRYLIFEETKRINVVKSLIANIINNPKNEHFEVIKKIKQYDISSFDLDFIRNMIEVMGVEDNHHHIDLVEEYHLIENNNDSQSYYKMYNIKYYLIAVPIFGIIKDDSELSNIKTKDINQY